MKKECKNCGKEFFIKPYRKNTAKFCSSKCNGSYLGFQKGYTSWNKGMPMPEKIKEILKMANTGRKASLEIKKKLSLSKMGEKNPRYGKVGTMLGKKHSLENRTKMSIIQKRSGRKPPSRLGMKGEKCGKVWQGGKSFEPYTIDWTQTLKRSIRERDKYTCQICGKEPSICCHHIDYNKKNCNPDNLIILCRICHQKTNFNRNDWREFFKKFVASTESPRDSA